MINWTERAKREIRHTGGLSTAITDDSTPTTVTAVTSTRTTAISRVSIGTNGSAASASFPNLKDKESSRDLLRDSAKEAQITKITKMRDARSENRSNAASTARGWLIHFLNNQFMEVYFCPAVTHAEALVSYPDAVAAEPVPDTQRRSATKPEVAELTHLVALILPNEPEEQEEALANALTDVDAALLCFRHMLRSSKTT